MAMDTDTESDLDDEDFVVGTQLPCQHAGPDHDLAKSATQPEDDNNMLENADGEPADAEDECEEEPDHHLRDKRRRRRKTHKQYRRI